MPRSDPLPRLTGDVFVIGGGPSLRSFDFRQLMGKQTIGCNQAFLLGPGICNICVFGDNPPLPARSFWREFRDELSQYEGWVVTNHHNLPDRPSWLHRFKRIDEGLCDDGETLAWNRNTGALAINLALTLGADRVLLLGIDLQTHPDATHWHPRAIETPTPDHHSRFADGFSSVALMLSQGMFPGRQVATISDGSPRLTCFPVLTYADVGLKP
jgi:hypothetical protein